MQKWTSADGRILLAEWIQQVGDVVTLKLENGRLAQVPLAQLSAQSQASARFVARFNGREPTYHWTIYAGHSTERGKTDGSLKDARFSSPGGMAFDASNNLFVADVENNTIRKITPDGNVNTYAGKAGVSGEADGELSAARFHHPCGLVFDPDGSLWVVDAVNSTLRKITEGRVVTVAGATGRRVSYGHEDGKGTEARFFFPWAAVLDSSGNVFVTDSENGTVRRVTPGGDVTTFAGKARDKVFFVDGKGDQARFASPRGLAIDQNGCLYVCDPPNHVIRKISPAGEVSTFAGQVGASGRSDGMLDEARFFSPTGLAMDATGALFVADLGSCTIRKISANGQVSTIGGTPGMVGKQEGAGSVAHFVYPNRIAVDREGVLYVDDLDKRVIYRGVPK